MSNNDQGFFDALGLRIADLRKAQELTQAELGALLGVSQQTINSFEKGRRRVTASALPELSRILGVSVENLIGANPARPSAAPSPSYNSSSRNSAGYRSRSNGLSAR